MYNGGVGGNFISDIYFLFSFLPMRIKICVIQKRNGKRHLITYKYIIISLLSVKNALPVIIIDNIWYPYISGSTTGPGQGSSVSAEAMPGHDRGDQEAAVRGDGGRGGGGGGSLGGLGDSR